MSNVNNATGLRIRPAQIGESDDLTQLAIDSKAHWNYTPEQIQMWRAELTVPIDAITSGRTYVGEIDYNIVAMMVLTPAALKWRLDYFFVAPAQIGQGIGKAMFQQAIDMAKKGGARAVTIDADPHDESFYVDCGAVRSHTVAAPIPDDSSRIRPQMLFLIPTRKAGLPA